MNGETVALIENLCRTCMKGDKEANMENEAAKWKVISIFNKTEIMECENITIMELLLLTTPQLNIDTGDMLPKILCENCLESLVSAYKFQQMCVAVEQKLQQMIKEEPPGEFQMNKDPLKDNIMDGPIENVANSQYTNNDSDIKTEMDEPLIDQEVSKFRNKTLVDESEDIKNETDDNRWQDVSDSDATNGIDSDSQWETLSHKAKR